MTVGKLAIGTRVSGRDGWAEVVSMEDSGRTETVYNFEVADFHTYFVGDGGFWAHSTCVKSGEIVKVVEQSDGVAILAARNGDETVEVIANVAREGDTLVLGQVHIQGSSPGGVGVKRLREFVVDFGRANGAHQVRVEGALRTTGPASTRTVRPRAWTVKVPQQ